MNIVVDANILFSALIKAGKTEELFFNSNLTLFAPCFIFDEFEKYKIHILSKTSRSEEDFDRLLRILRKRIHLIHTEEKYIQQASYFCPDRKDVKYMALSLKLQCSLWSNDSELKIKQDQIKVYTTTELLEMFF